MRTATFFAGVPLAKDAFAAPFILSLPDLAATPIASAAPRLVPFALPVRFGQNSGTVTEIVR